MRDLPNNTAKESFVIFSTDVPDTTLEAFKHLEVDYIEVEGCWHGQTKRSFVINSKDLDPIMTLGVLNSETAILRLGPVDPAKDARPATVEYLKDDRAYLTGDKCSIGYFWSVSYATAKTFLGYTRDGDRCFVAAYERPVAAHVQTKDKISTLIKMPLGHFIDLLV